MTKRVLICGNPDLNFVDGSSIWSQTITLATAATGKAKVDFLAKSTPVRDELYAPLKANADITLVDSSDPRHWQGRGFSRITPSLMGELAIRMDRENSYDVIIVRGLEIVTAFLDEMDVLAKSWIYLTDIPQAAAEYSVDERMIMQRIAKGCQLLLCQNEGFKALWQTLVPDLDADKVRLYTPVIPDLPECLTPIRGRSLQAIYAGKFKGEWMTLKMAEAWPAIQRELPGSELVMIGDKIHDDPNQPHYAERMKRALQNTQGLIWRGAQSREAVQEQLRQARVGLSWRHEKMNDTLEYSTKILEYGGAGCAAILNRNPLHERLLGREYPLFANSETEFSQQLSRALRDPQVAQQAADTLKQLAELHTFSVRVKEIRGWLTEKPKANSKIKVLVAGHDLKFFAPLKKKLETVGQFEFLIDQWQGHNMHDKEKSFSLLKNADVIICEWCLGNLKWYSHNKKPHQRLIARFHAQEANTPYLSEANLENIDHISFVSEHTRRKALEVFDRIPVDKTSVIPNYLDGTKFTLRKKTGDASYTIGMLGIVPKMKRVDRALDLLEALLEEDSRYCLRVKGKNPLDYGWLLNREDELAYYKNFFERINRNNKLRYKVIFDPPGDDINSWFTMVGFILSPSDHESFHMAIGEGMLTGARPIIWNWDGATELWGSKYVISSLQDAKKAIVNGAPTQELSADLKSAMCSENVFQRWRSILCGN